MVKQASTNTSTNTAFFKAGGREAAQHETMAHARADEKPVRNHRHGAKMQGKEGQPNFIPGEAPVGQTSRTRPAKKK
jgi:hypothetical protein